MKEIFGIESFSSDIWGMKGKLGIETCISKRPCGVWRGNSESELVLLRGSLGYEGEIRNRNIFIGCLGYEGEIRNRNFLWDVWDMKGKFRIQSPFKGKFLVWRRNSESNLFIRRLGYEGEIRNPNLVLRECLWYEGEIRNPNLHLRKSLWNEGDIRNPNLLRESLCYEGKIRNRNFLKGVFRVWREYSWSKLIFKGTFRVWKGNL
jgi:hypothetical protein